jgi:pilus assembly protein Flp/PilA
MVKFLILAKNFLKEKQEGATMVEYALMIALIAAVCVTTVAAIGTGANGKFGVINGYL